MESYEYFEFRNVQLPIGRWREEGHVHDTLPLSRLGIGIRVEWKYLGIFPGKRHTSYEFADILGVLTPIYTSF